MGNQSNASLKKNILNAINQIEEYGYQKANIEAIRAFLLGDKNSRIFRYCSEVDGFGKYKYLDIKSVDDAVYDLVKEEKIRKSNSKHKKFYYEINDEYEPAYVMLNNHKYAKEYSEDYFLRELNDWSKKSPFPIRYPHAVKLSDGYVFVANGEPEEKLVKRLDHKDMFLHIRGNSFCIKIPYKNKKYYPDIIVYTKEGKIGIIEVKPMLNMADYKVIEKYEALKKYCEKRGFMYVMCDYQYHTYDFQRKRKVSDEVKAAVKKEFNKKGKFTDCDLDLYTRGLSSGEKTRWENEVSALVIQRGFKMRFNLNERYYTFEINSKPKEIKKDKTGISNIQKMLRRAAGGYFPNEKKKRNS